MAKPILNYAHRPPARRSQLIPATLIAFAITSAFAGAGWALDYESRTWGILTGDLGVLLKTIFVVVWAGAMFATFVWSREKGEQTS